MNFATLQRVLGRIACHHGGSIPSHSCRQPRSHQKARKIRFYSVASSNETENNTYIDEWFPTIIKTSGFYEHHADPNNNNLVRSYFYNIDLQGRLFLEETLPKNIATSIKDDRFLNFFFRRIRHNNSELSPSLSNPDHHQQKWPILATGYPFISVCNKYEINYIRPAACPIVFHSLIQQQQQQTRVLQHAGTLETTFSPHLLAVSAKSGRLYHQLPSSSSSLGYGLIRSSVAVQLSEHLDVNDHDGRWVYHDENNNESGVIIPWLPIEYEPGPWGMPVLQQQ